MAEQMKTIRPGRNNSSRDLLEQILTLNGDNPGNASEAIRRVKSLARKSFEAKGLPGPKNEEYKYTDISGALKRIFNFDQHPPAPGPDVVGHCRNHSVYKEKAYIVATINGKIMPELCVLPAENTGITILSMEEASKKFPGLTEPLFGKIAPAERDGYVAMNTMLTGNGVAIFVRDNSTPDHPVVLLNLMDSSEGEVIAHPHNVINIGRNSRMRIIEINEEMGTQPVFRNSVTEVSVEKHAHLHYYKLQNFGEENVHVDNTSVDAYEGSSVNTYTFSFNGKILRNNLNITLKEEHSEAHLYGLYIAGNKSLIDNHTVVDHRVPDCFSNELYKGIMDDYSTCVFNGKIYVRPGAQKTNAFQSNHNILLSKTAKIDAKPQLEIWADDVKCTHGCTTGQINKEHLFYMRSRGISEADARTLLLQAFASDILNKVDIPFLKANISALIKTRIHPKFS